ncbi:MAG: TetR/AcrR family transcriptional regulator [Lachnospiraceae bacterium]|nr:TetR/AcrR family transcriptional regulator [Lachnospiraceae bacterium]MDE7204861.1 TetR/AcrR family transcriptional regulator [Lachnospiraceae bacterium]
MPDTKKTEKKYNLILDALQQLLEEKKIQNISVSEIAHKAGIGKGSIYYYFPSKDAILDALIERSYEQPLLTAKTLAAQTEVSPFTRMAMLFQACQTSSTAFIKQNNSSSDSASAQDLAFLHQKYLAHVVSELKPALTEIIKQGIENGEIHFDSPAALAEIVLIVIAVKLDNSLLPSTPAETAETLQGLITLLEKGTGIASGTLSYLSLTPYMK